MKIYKIKKHTEPEWTVKNFRWQTDTENNARITWQWPDNTDVKYMLAAAITEGPATANITADPLKWLMQNPQAHTVITRNLAAHYEIAIGDAPRRFIFAPAYLMKKDIAVYGPALITDLLYAKTHATVRIKNTQLPFSPYKKVTFTLTYSDTHGTAIGKDALHYTLHEFNRYIGTYPLDETLCAGGYLHIKKTQHIRFEIIPEYAHLIALV